MLISVNWHPTNEKKGRKKASEGRKPESRTENRLSFLKLCARKEGITLNDRIWARIEKLIETEAKW